MQETHVPGVSIVIVDDARIAWRRSFGVKDAAANLPVDGETMFEAASMSKAVFAYVVMKLCETGLLDLDTPLTKYTPERFLDGDPRLDRISARHVLSHTSGLPNWRSDTTPLSIHFTPGEQYQYSGEGYNYLQTVVTRLLKQPFDRYMHDRLFAPLSMTSSQYLWDDRAGGRMARPHGPDGAPWQNNRSDAAEVARYGSAGALLTTPNDFAKFLIEVIDPKPADAFRLTAASLKEMIRPHVKLTSGPVPASWALGWQIFHNGRGDFIYHGGNNRGFHCGAVGTVAGKRGFVAMTNGQNGATIVRNVLMTTPMQEFMSASSSR